LLFVAPPLLFDELAGNAVPFGGLPLLLDCAESKVGDEETALCVVVVVVVVIAV